MLCPGCGRPSLIVEDLGDGRKKRKCSKCGFNEIVDEKGRRLLTGDMGKTAQVICE
jgi:hypothetical protein